MADLHLPSEISPAIPSHVVPEAPPNGENDDNGIRVQLKGVYLILQSTGYASKYHWGVFIATTATEGLLFHQTIGGTNWRYVVEPEDLSKSQRLLAALQVGEVDDITEEWVDAMKQCIQSTRVAADELTCRTWALAALFEFANGGFIGLTPRWATVHKIEEEAKRAAAQAALTGITFVTISEHIAPC